MGPTGCQVVLGHKAAQRRVSHRGRARRPGSTSAALLCQIPSPPGSTPAGMHVRQLERHGQQGLALLRVINRALFDLSGAAAGGSEYWGMCCAF